MAVMILFWFWSLRQMFSSEAQKTLSHAIGMPSPRQLRHVTLALSVPRRHDKAQGRVEGQHGVVYFVVGFDPDNSLGSRRVGRLGFERFGNATATVLTHNAREVDTGNSRVCWEDLKARKANELAIAEGELPMCKVKGWVVETQSEKDLKWLVFHGLHSGYICGDLVL